MIPKVKFGLTLSNRGVLLGLTQPEEILEMAELAESSEAFDHVWVGDSIMAKPRMESITLMSGIAAQTKREDWGRVYGQLPFTGAYYLGISVGQHGPAVEWPDDFGRLHGRKHRRTGTSGRVH